MWFAGLVLCCLTVVSLIYSFWWLYEKAVGVCVHVHKCTDHACTFTLLNVPDLFCVTSQKRQHWCYITSDCYVSVSVNNEIRLTPLLLPPLLMPPLLMPPLLLLLLQGSHSDYLSQMDHRRIYNPWMNASAVFTQYNVINIQSLML